MMIKISSFQMTTRIALFVGSAAATFVAQSAALADSNRYRQHNLVSDGSIAADHVDPNLVNAWGIAFNPTGVWWINDNHSGFSTLYSGTGVINSLVVTVPGPGDPPAQGAPTGIVFSGGSDFVVNDGAGHSAPARFIFAGEDGIISGWAPTVPPPPPATVAHVAVDNSSRDAIYKGLALASVGSGHRLYATDFHNAKVDVFDGLFQPVNLPGGFVDNHLPDHFAPFGIAAINGKIYVAYAKQDAEGEDDVAGPHLGYVDVFNTNGVLLKRLIKRGKLNAPWGLALAPSNFGKFSNRLLVGNFGDGRINAYDINNGHSKGTLKGTNNHPIEIDGLWGLAFGNGGDAGPTNVLFFTAGPGNEEHGLFGSLSAVPSHGHDDGDDGDDDDGRSDDSGD